MRPVMTYVTRSVVCVSVCVLVTREYYAKMAEPIEILFRRADSCWCMRSGNGVGRINEVTLCRARLVLGWVTCPGSTP